MCVKDRKLSPGAIFPFFLLKTEVPACQLDPWTSSWEYIPQPPFGPFVAMWLHIGQECMSGSENETNKKLGIPVYRQQSWTRLDSAKSITLGDGRTQDRRNLGGHHGLLLTTHQPGFRGDSTDLGQGLINGRTAIKEEEEQNCTTWSNSSWWHKLMQKT